MTSSKQTLPFPSLSKVIFAIGRVTFYEIIRDKILYNTALIALGVLAIGFLAGRISFFWSDRIILDFGISGLKLSGAIIGILIGSSALGREIEKRTIVVALSHPISKPQFIFGKFAGVLGVQFFNWILLSVLTLLISLPFTEKTTLILGNTTLWIALLYIFIQNILITSVAVFFSTVTTTSLAITFSVGLYLIGNNISEIQALLSKGMTEGQTWMIYLLTGIFPNLQNYNLGTQVIYALPLSAGNIIFSILYGLCYSLFLLIISGYFLQGREI